MMKVMMKAMIGVMMNVMMKVTMKVMMEVVMKVMMMMMIILWAMILNYRSKNHTSPGEKNNDVQDDCSESMLLKEEKVDVVVEEEKMEVEETREKESCQSVGASTGGSTHFTPRSTHADVILPTPQPFPCFQPFPNLFTPFFTPPNLPLYATTPVGQMPGSFWVLCGACKSWGTIVT